MHGASLSEVWGEDFTVKKKKKTKKYKAKPLTPDEMDSELLVKDEQKELKINEYERANNLSESIRGVDPFYSFNKNIVTNSEPYGRRPRVIEEDPDYEEFMRFKAMKNNSKKEFHNESLKTNNSSDHQLNELLLYIFTGFFLLIIYDNMYNFGKKSY